MKLSKDELLEKVKSAFGESTDEIYISLLEDITDSMEDNTQELTAQIETLNAQIEELKQKYIDRFFNAGTTSEDETISDETDETIETDDVTIDDLFEDVEKKDEA